MQTIIGFSTGAIALSDFRGALAALERCSGTAVELSALRVEELPEVIAAASALDLSRYAYVSLHAPSRFSAAEEGAVIEGVRAVAARGWPIVLHPDTVHRWEAWRELGPLLLIENMDKRKPTGRTAAELAAIFARLPDARLCFDIAHARQYDGSMTEAYRILRTFGSRVAEVHISEVSSRSTHGRISRYAAGAFRQVARLIPAEAPVIIESRVTAEQIESEVEVALGALVPLDLRQTA
jgi:sugar phosphate isomerase/epimerase